MKSTLCARLSPLIGNIPNNSRLIYSLIPKALITALEAKTESMIKETRDFGRGDAYRREQRWLNSIKGFVSPYFCLTVSPVVLVDYNAPTGIKRVDNKLPTKGKSRTPTRRSGSVYSLHDDDTSSDEDSETPNYEAGM